MTHIILELAERVERLTVADRETDLAIQIALYPSGNIAELMKFPRGIDGRVGTVWEISGGAVLFERRDERGNCYYNGGWPLPCYTGSIDAVRNKFEGMCVFASEIGADGLPMVKLVTDTTTTPIVEHTGIAMSLTLAWLAAALRAKGHAVIGEKR